jgi:magnesium chelatase family protein
MLAQRLPGILPPLAPIEALEVSMIHSVAGVLSDGKLMRRRPFRDPHHSASLPPTLAATPRRRSAQLPTDLVRAAACAR